ncbi:MAG: Zn-dependent hydrolase [Acidimicrobiia bacterium]|nr:Zn-dependent hydrolase [Acidimicrobiia bacterium]
MPAAQLTDLRVDADRLVRRIEELGAIGGLEGGGCARLALTDEDRLGRDLVGTWMEDLGLDVHIDAIGNVVGTLAGREDGAPVMTGSHIDTVATGGLYDGNLGVLAGLEVLETLARAGVTTRRPMAVGYFTDEEGARFAPDMLGSLVYVGGLTVEDAYDVVGVDGAVLGEELDRIGYRGATPCPGRTPFAFVELHIEQGPVLEDAAIGIGVVTGVQGISWQEVRVTGRSSHAGTTPMHLRRDAGYVAMRLGTFVRELAGELGEPQVGTVGRLDLRPDLVNVVAASATMTVDLRNVSEAVLEEAEWRFAACCDELAAAEHCTIERTALARFAPVDFDPRVVDLVEATARRLGNTTLRMPSGAGHDAQMMARVCPTAMVFVPSVGGISHNVEEFTEPADLEAGANVLLQTLLHLAETEADDWAEADHQATESPWAAS